MSNQLVKKNPAEGYQNIFPKTWIDAIKDKESGVSLQEILQGFNMYFLSYNGSRALTRCKVPSILRKEGLWITYVLYDHTVVTEWYNSDQIDDNSWSMDSNWRVASNFLVGDVSVSADGYWVINGEKTEAKAQGEQGVTPLLRVGANNKLQVSYNAGKAWKDISDYIVPRFKWNQGVGTTAGTIQISMDLGKTWTNLSNEITNNLRISRYIGTNESLPTSGVAEGTIYMKGPYYDESDTSHANPIYRMWVYAWKDNTLAWQDNGEFTSISAGVVQERGTSTTKVMSQDAVSKELSKLESKNSQLGQETGIKIKLEPTSNANRVHAIVKGGVNIEVNSDYCINYVLNITNSLNEVLVNSNSSLEKYVLNVVGEYDIVFARKDNTNIDVNDDIIKIFSSRNVDTLQGFPIIDVNSIKADDGNFTTPTARNNVPVHLRKTYSILKYKTSSGVVFEQFMDNPQSQDAWVYGTYKRLFSGNYIYANELLNVDVIANKEQARLISGVYSPKGSIILYYMSDGWHIELKTETTSSTLDRYYKEIALKDYVDEKITGTTNSSLYNGAIEKVLMSDDYEVGGIDDSGNDVNADFCFRTKKIKVLYPCVVFNQTAIVAYYYDYSGAYIGKSSGNPFTKNDIDIPDTAGYVRLVIDNRTHQSVSSYNRKCVIGRKLETNDGLVLSSNREKYFVIDMGNWENGYFDANGVYRGTHEQICYTPKFIPVKRGDVVRAISQNFGVVVAEYASNNEASFIEGSDGLYMNNYIHTSFPYMGDYIVKNDGYVRLEVMKYAPVTGERENISSADIGVVCIIVHALSYFENKIIRNNKFYNAKIDLLLLQTQNSVVGNDGTVINNQLWCFGASEENDGYVRKFDLATNEVTETITHNLGHCNCVDYCKKTDTLITTDVLGHTIPDDKRVYLQLLSNPVSKQALSQSDCIRIPMFTNDLSRYVYAQFVFGESFNIVYGFEYAFDGNHAYKLELGVGNNDYSADDNGFGTFISGKGAFEYNGTAKLLKVYDGIIHEGEDTFGGQRGGAQGMCYDGYLYLCWSVGKTNILAIELDDVANEFRVVRNYSHKFYEDADGSLDYEPEIITEYNQKLYAGCRRVIMNNNVVTKIKGAIFSFNK